jgi:4-carboxymuconolactone decarboxylase
VREEHVLTEELTGEKREVADWFAAELRRELHTTHRLWLQKPPLARLILELGHYVRFVALNYRQREMIIMAVARHQQSETAWNIHYPTAIEAGLSEAALESIRDGKVPADLDEVDLVVLASCQRLLENNRLSDDEYRTLKDAIGAEGIVELVAVTGFYVMLSMHIGAFDI